VNQQAWTLFQDLVELTPDQRERALAQLDITPEIRTEVESLLAYDSQPGELTEVVGSFAANALAATAPESCGPYRILRLIGEGGMGAVYLAERTDGEIQHQVAIKLLRAGAAGPWRTRFLQERQVLASLQHPSIVHVLDAGHTTAGRPYLVMEYVEGAPIDTYSKSLDVRAILELFLKVCEAVAHAHSRLIIHRDLKPSNILVTPSGEPKLLDFGIAKLLDAPDATQTIDRLLTPEYASPEQMLGAPQTTATDVYSLGIVLHKLLKGRSPNTTASADPITNTDLPRDLDFILAKALRKEPEERYASVEAFAGDIRAFLEWRPVRARSGNAAYRTRKFLRRYRLPVAAAALVIVSLASGLYIADRQRRIAQQRFQEVRQLAHTFVFDLHDEVLKLDGSTKALEMMTRTGLLYLDNLARSAGNDLELQKEIAAGYSRIADVQGNRNIPNLGRFGDARASYLKAGEIYRRIAAKDPRYLTDLALLDIKLAGFLRTTDAVQGKELTESAIQIFDRARSRQRLDLNSERAYTIAFCTLGDMENALGHYQKGWTQFSRCRDLAREQLKANRTRQWMQTIVIASERIGRSSRDLGRLTEGLHAIDDAESTLAELRIAEPHNPQLHRMQDVLAQLRSSIYNNDTGPNLGDPQHALEGARRDLAMTIEMVRADPDNTDAKQAQALASLRVAYSLREFDPGAAVRLAREAVQMWDELLAAKKADELVNLAIARRILAQALLKASRPAEARRAAEAALAIHASPGAKDTGMWEDQGELVQSLIVAAEADSAAGDYQAAEKLLLQARLIAQGLAKRPELRALVPLAGAEEALGGFYARRGVKPEARACYERLDGLWRRYPETNEYVTRQIAATARLLAALR
jgi:tetratricopeptide (TPR) repeat protein/predicted Ser/Thr protein kinase